MADVPFTLVTWPAKKNALIQVSEIMIS
jgi:hypothetical protein